MSSFSLRPAFALMGSVLALSACQPSNMDWDLRSGLNTSDAARNATDSRPQPDGRGVISYPGYQVAVARRGDTVTSVAARLGLAPGALASYNAMGANDPLRDGEIVALPNRVASATDMGTSAGLGASIAPGTAFDGTPTSQSVDVGAIATSALDRAAPAGSAKAPTPSRLAPATTAAASRSSGTQPVRHKVTRGETAFSIARTYNVSAKSLADWNGLGSDLGVREGQYLIIPTASGKAPPSAVAVTTVPGTGSPTPEPPSAKEPLPDEKPLTAAQAKKDIPPSPDLGKQRSASSASKFAMPTSGSIIRGYAKKKNEGIDIGASAGSPVVAASAGSVAAITMDTQQTPIIVIRHEGNLLTVYAGVDAIKVKKGDKVKRGQQLASVRSGSPSFLHFEVRKGIESVDPIPYLQ
jgi:murein DD-endopeptidase MepM/ murein hydrolase activator NlpD